MLLYRADFEVVLFRCTFDGIIERPYLSIYIEESKFAFSGDSSVDFGALAIQFTRSSCLLVDIYWPIISLVSSAPVVRQGAPVVAQN